MKTEGIRGIRTWVLTQNTEERLQIKYYLALTHARECESKNLQSLMLHDEDFIQVVDGQVAKGDRSLPPESRGGMREQP